MLWSATVSVDARFATFSSHVSSAHVNRFAGVLGLRLRCPCGSFCFSSCDDVASSFFCEITQLQPPPDVEDRVCRYRQSLVAHANSEDTSTNVRSMRFAIIDGLHNG